MNWATIAILVVTLLVIIFVAMSVRARSIARRHSATLSNITGIPADQIYRELTTRNLTPGEWAVRHGLDFWSFAPTTAATDRFESLIAENWPFERIRASSQGIQTSGMLVVVVATDQAVYTEVGDGFDRVEYQDIGGFKAESDSQDHPDTSLLALIDGAAIRAHFLDPYPLEAVINDRLEKITLHTERVELVSTGGALFRWRRVGDKWDWWITYDKDLRDPDGQVTDEARAATTEALRTLNKRIDD